MIDYTFTTTKKDIRRFALAVPIALVMWGLLLGFRYHWGGQSHFWLFGVAALLFLWGQVAPLTLKPLYVGWMYLTRTVAWLLTHVVLFLVFILGFMLVGGLMRLFGKDPMHRKIDRRAASYWQPRPPYCFSRVDYDRQF